MHAGAPYLPFKKQLHPPRHRLPAGSCDCHFHVFEDAARYPFAEERGYTPTPATLADYRHMADTLGIDRAVLVHPSIYGADHRSFEDILAQCGDWMRGVAVVRPETPNEQIERWHALGARGTRCQNVAPGGAQPEDLPDIVEKVRHLGWHLQLFFDVSADPDAVSRAADLGLPIVVDHFGNVEASKALGDRGFANLLSLVREGRAWVKLSAAYRVTQQPGRFEAVAPLAEALVRANPRQLLWGSDWPHPMVSSPMPDDSDIADALFDWLSEAERNLLLVENPTRLYWAD